MKLIHADEKDERFLSLVEELDYGYYQRIGDELEKYKQYNEFKDPHFVILMLDGDEAIACASYRKFNEKSVEFKRVYVKKQYRKKGYGRLLIESIKKQAINNTNFDKLFLYSSHDNLYEKFGWKCIESINNNENKLYELDLK